MTASLRFRLAFFLVGILVWIGVALGIYLIDPKLSLTAFFVSDCVFTVVGLSFLYLRPPPRVAARFRVLFSSMFVFSLSAGLFVIAYLTEPEGVVFYIALALLIAGSGEMLVLVSRSARHYANQFVAVSSVPTTKMTSREIYADYPTARARFWGLLIGLGFALGFASASFAFSGNPTLSAWSLLMVPSFGLLAGSIIGLWLDLRKHRRRKLDAARATV